MAATPVEIARFRNIIGEPDDANGWTDERISEIIEEFRLENGTVEWRKLSAAGWLQKAAEYVRLVDIAESGSSRRMAQAFEHALAMAKMYGADDDAISEVYPSSTKIVRPVP